MQLGNVLFVLLGAGLVSIGVLTTAIADRIRGICPRRAHTAVRESAPRAVTPRAARLPIEVVDLAPTPSPRPKAKPPSTESKMPAMADEVIAALVDAGYKKSLATDAAKNCSQAERATIESWMCAALRHCTRGGMS